MLYTTQRFNCGKCGVCEHHKCVSALAVSTFFAFTEYVSDPTSDFVKLYVILCWLVTQMVAKRSVQTSWVCIGPV